MLLLAADTSGRAGSIALARGDANGSFEVLDVVPLAGGTFSAQLVPQIAALLTKHGFGKQDIGAFFVASGPGSFTGLRIGLAAIKALAEILEKPIAAVSLLEAFAVGAKAQGRVLALLDAGRSEVYCGDYDITDNSAQLRTERLIKREDLFAEAHRGQLPWSEPRNALIGQTTIGDITLATSDQSLAAAARAAGLSISLVEPIDAGTIARLGWRKIRAGETVSPEQLEANYIRRTDAEILEKIKD
ncbi:MAG: tRNA (adenosine(37)-N6)-threonylcarbamoyltransferase complex dimerization subunit type 1 TsaB [Candidatus Sulfotelmatobacter sp.]